MLVGEASIRLDAIADDLKKTINRDINDALAGVKIDSDPLVKMTQNLRRAELDLITAEDQLTAAHRGTIESEARLENLRRSGTATANEVSSAERALTRARAEEAVTADKVTVANQKLAAAHGALTKATTKDEVQQRSWIRTVLGSSSVIDSVVSKLNIFGRRTKDAGDEGSRTGTKIKNLGNDASGLGKIFDGVLGGALKFVSGQFSAMGDVGGGVFSVLTSKAVLLPAALLPLLGLIGGLLTALPALAFVGGAALGAIALGMDGIKKAFEPLKGAFDDMKKQVSESFRSALVPAVEALRPILPVITNGLQQMATALGGTVTMLSQLVAQSNNLNNLKEIFRGTAQFIQGMQPGIAAFTQGFINLAAAVAPQLQILGNAFGSLFLSIGRALDRIAASGQVTKIIDGLASVLNSVANLLGPIIDLFARLAVTLQGPLSTIIDAIAAGLQAAMPGIQAFADGIAKAFVALAPLISAVLPLVAQIAGLIGSVLATAIQTLAPPLTKLIEGLAKGLAPVLPKIADAFASLGEALAPVLDQLAGALVESLNSLLPIIPQLVGAITQLAPVFLDIVKAVIPLIPPLVQLVATILPGLIRLWLLVEKPMLTMAAVILNQVVPALVSFVQIVTTGVGKVVDFFTDFDTNVKVIWGNIVSFFSGIGSSIGGFFSGIGEKIVGWFQAGIDFLAGLPARIGEWLSTLPGIVGNWLLEAGKAMLYAVGQGIEWVIAEFIALPFQIVAALVGLAQLLWQVATDAWTGFVNSAKTIGADLINWVLGLPQRIWEGLQSLASTLYNLASNAWNNFKQAALDAGIALFNFAVSIPGRIRSALANLLSTLRDIAVNAWNTFVNSGKQAGENIWGWIKSIPGRIWDILGNLGSFLYDAGKNIIQGFINGIKAAAGAVGDVVSGILSKVRRLLPFSPAKEGPFSGRGWSLYSGMSIMEAMAEGLRIAGDQAIDQAAKVAGAIQSAIGVITPVVNAPEVAAPRIGDLTKGGAQTATAQLLALQALADSLVLQGKTLPEDLAAAIAQLSVVVSADEADTQLKKVDQTNARRR